VASRFTVWGTAVKNHALNLLTWLLAAGGGSLLMKRAQRRIRRQQVVASLAIVLSAFVALAPGRALALDLSPEGERIIQRLARDLDLNADQIDLCQVFLKEFMEPSSGSSSGT